jgi:NitT/TauT family transport system ATP-binding protein
MATVIEAQQVGKTYHPPDGRAVVALEDVSVVIEEGTSVALLGPSGCGKSTLLNIFAGLDTASGGRVTIDGRAPTPHAEVGVMFQRPSLLAWRTAKENVLLPAELLGLDKHRAAARADELLDLVGLAQWSDRYPWQLSGGMQQRVALARVLLPDPDIILLDEPFGALDEMTRETLDVEQMRLVERGGKTVVTVTHSVYEAVLMSDRIVVLSAHPGTVAGIVDIDLPGPRSIETSGTPAFAAKVAEVRSHLRTDEGIG